MSVWHILISGSVSAYCRDVVSLLLVFVRDCLSAVGYDSNIVLMIGLQSESCWLSIGPKSGDSIPNFTQNDPDMSNTGFTVSSATLSVADSWPIQWKFCVFVGFVSVWPAWLGYNKRSSSDEIKSQPAAPSPITMTSSWASWRLKLPANRLFV